MDTISNPSGTALSLARKRARLAQLLREKAGAPGKFPLSFAQQRLWLLDQLTPGNPFYNIARTVVLTGSLKVKALEQSLNELIRRHEALRTRFVLLDGEPAQLIDPALSIPLPVEDLTTLPESLRETQAQQLAREEARCPFDLARGPLLRVRLLCLGPEKHVLLLTLHHIIADGWSLAVVFRELGALYTAFSMGQQSPLPKLSLQYADYTLWQREWLTGPVLGKQLAYWRQQLAGVPALLNLPADRPRPAVQAFQGACESVHFSPELTAQLKALSQQEDVTLFMILLAAFQMLLARYSGQEDISVGMPIANRMHAELEELIGFFSNTLVLRTDLSDNPSVRELLRRVREVALGAYTHQDLPFEYLVEELRPQRDLSYNPLFQVMISMNNTPHASLELTGLTLHLSPTENNTTKFDLHLSLWEEAEELKGEIEYNTDLFEESTMKRLAGHYRQLLTVMVVAPEQRIGSLSFLTPAERQQLLLEWNTTGVALSAVQGVHRLFEAQVERTPEAIAVVWEDERLSYAELNRRANQLAWYLQEMGVGPEARVGLCLERSLELIIGLLGILKAGGAYVPLDWRYPKDRLAFMLRDSEVLMLLTQTALRSIFPNYTGKILCLDSLWTTITHQPDVNLTAEADSDHLAYIIYTSGSTGWPKGIAMPHRPLVNLLHWQSGASRLAPGAKTLQFTSVSFDVAFQEMFATWYTGGALQLIQEQERQDIVLLVRLLQQQEIERLFLPFVALQQVAEVCAAENVWPTKLKEINTAGEQLRVTPALVQFFERLPECTLQNHYGPSETHAATAYTLEGPCEDWMVSPPIGRPIENAKVYICDRQLEPVPVGVTGELYLGGMGIARGYLNRPDLTAERFIPDPWSGEPGARMYKSGDLAHYLPDGTIEYLGRSDTQVKIRGFRIEPGEIEATLSQHPAIREVAVTVREDVPGDKRLVAYLLVQPGERIASSALRTWLKERLPEYMIPAVFLELDAFPLTPSGKLDRRRLPAVTPEQSQQITAQTPVAARTPTEELLADIWAEVLSLTQIGIFDNFFELGGHSLLATRLIARLRETFQIDLPLRRLFEAPTIADFAQVIVSYQGKQELYEQSLTLLPVLLPAPEERYQPFPMSDVLQAYWIGQNAAFELGNVSTHSYLEAHKRNLNLERFTRAWQRLITRHDMLRTIVLPDGQLQILREVPPYQIQVIDLRGRSSQDMAAHKEMVRQRMSHQILSADAWPQFELLVTLLDEQEAILHLSMGPLTGDGASWIIIDTELALLYANPDASLPPLDISYRDYVLAKLALKPIAIYQRAQEYWQRRLPSLPPAPDLPLACSPASLPAPQFVRRSLILKPEDWQQIKKRTAQRGLTPSGVVLTAFAEVLARWSKSAHFMINMTVFNRLPLHSQVKDLVGDFTSLNLLEIDHTKPGTFTEHARRVQQQLWEDLDHRFFDGVQVLRELARIQGNALAARMPIVFSSMLGQQQVEQKGQHFFTGSIQYSITQTPQVWIDNQVVEREGGLLINWDAVEELFPPGLLDEMFEAYRKLFHNLACEEKCWNEFPLPLLPEWQVEQQRTTNLTDAPLTSELLHTLFLAQVPQRRSHPAVITPRKMLTYEELFLRASLVGRRLRDLGVQPDTLVGVIMEKGWEQVVAVLGILLAGAAYLPIEASLPDQRIAYLLEHGEVSIALTQSWLEEKLPWPAGLRRFNLDILEPAPADADPLEIVQRPGDLAYVIYTSGSTGQPKGVMIDHAGAVNTILDINKRFDVGPGDRVLALSSLSFDLSVYDIFGTLAAGATIVFPEASSRQDPAHWATLLAQQNVTIWNSVPALLEVLVEYLNNRSIFLPASLRMALLSGDWLPLTLPDRVKALTSGIQIISLGGATEASIWSILYPIQQVESTWKSIPYGRPMLNQRFYVLNELLEPCPTWVPGQLYIGGAGLARGYWHDEEKTQASFIQHPRSHERLYRTGDLGRYLPDGTIEFLGREDLQVKIQGYRIELSEIEAALMRSAGVHTALVVAQGQQGGNRHLVAYVVPKAGVNCTSNELRGFLEQQLPGYMIPSAFVLLETLPLTPNGKIDRGALPEAAPVPTAPVNGAEPASVSQIAQLVATLLKLDGIDPEENLLDRGTNSIDLLRILNLLEKELHFRPSIASFFGLPTIRGLSDLYEAHRAQLPSLPRATDVREADSGLEVLRDPLEREAFKQKHLELRRGVGGKPVIPLPAPDAELQHELYLARRSQRHFTRYPMPFTRFSGLLNCLRRVSIDGIARHRYPSAGGLYPIQVYLQVKADRIEDLAAGVYYYHPVRHQLVLLAPDARFERTIYDPLINGPICDEAAFSIFLIAQLDAITPLYGSAARDFCLLEAGYMSQLLMEVAASHQIGLCPIGDLDFARIERFFDLDTNQLLIHSLLGGGECEEGEL